MANQEPSKRGDQVLGALLEHGDSLEKEVCTPGVAKNLERLGLLSREGRPLMLRLTEAGRARGAEYTRLLRAKLERMGVSLNDEAPGQQGVQEQAATSEPVPDDDGLELFRQSVADCRARVERYRLEEDTADATCMSLSLDDRDLPQWRERSVKAGHSLAQAQADLEEAQRDLELMSSPT